MTGINTYNFTDAETGTTIDASYVTDGTAKFWTRYVGTGTAAVTESLNQSSITDVGTGAFEHNLTTSMNSATYSRIATGNNADASVSRERTSSTAVGVVGDETVNMSGTSTDPSRGHTVIMGDLA